MRAGVCFIGGTRIARPLDPTAAKKFQALAALADTSVVAFSRTWRPARFRQHARFYLLAKLPLPVLRYALMSSLGALVTVWLALRQDARILVGQSPYEGVVAAFTKRVCALFGRPAVCIVESHGDFERALFLQRTVRLPSLHRWLMHRAARFALRHADLLRAVSDATRLQLESWAPGKPVVQFPAWSDLTPFHDAGARAGERRPAHLIYAGAAIPLRDLHTLIVAFAELARVDPDARLWMVGRRPDRAYAAALEARAASLGLADRVVFLDEVPQARLAELIARCAALVMPSRSEGLGRVVFEAMACGTPVVATAVGGLPELVQHERTGWLVPPGDVRALAERLRWVATHPAEARAAGARARTFMEHRFSAEDYVQGYRTLFERADAILASATARA